MPRSSSSGPPSPGCAATAATPRRAAARSRSTRSSSTRPTAARCSATSGGSPAATRTRPRTTSSLETARSCSSCTSPTSPGTRATGRRTSTPSASSTSARPTTRPASRTTEYAASAKLVAWLVRRYDIPVDRKHIIGHSQVPDPNDPALFGGSDHHTDPGPHWRWGYYLNLVRQYAFPDLYALHVRSTTIASGDTLTGIEPWRVTTKGRRAAGRLPRRRRGALERLAQAVRVRGGPRLEHDSRRERHPRARVARHGRRPHRVEALDGAHRQPRLRADDLEAAAVAEGLGPPADPRERARREDDRDRPLRRRQGDQPRPRRAVHVALELAPRAATDGTGSRWPRSRSTDASPGGRCRSSSRTAPTARTRSSSRRRNPSRNRSPSLCPSRRSSRRPSSTARRVGGVVDWRAHTIGPIARLQFVVDGNVLATATQEPWSASWDTTAVGAGAHVLVGARARQGWTRRRVGDRQCDGGAASTGCGPGCADALVSNASISFRSSMFSCCCSGFVSVEAKNASRRP